MQKVLDHGFVRLVDKMGSDAAIVQAARVSYAEGTKTVRDDRSLIRYLMRHQHTSPLEMCELKFHCKMPIFVARQWIRHRTASTNEVSGRYSVLPQEYYVPARENVKYQSKTNRQGGDKTAEWYDAKMFMDNLYSVNAQAYSRYDQAMQADISREQARLFLTLSHYTEWYWKINLHNLFHFLKLRLDSHAQYEIRVYAEAIAWETKNLFPMAYEAFEDYVLNARTFSKFELQALLGALDRDQLHELVDQLVDLGRLSQREGRELLSDTIPD